MSTYNICFYGEIRKHHQILLLNCCLSIVLGFDTSTLVGHFVSSPRYREKRDTRDSRRDESEVQGRKRNSNESEKTEKIKTFPLHARIAGLAQL